MVYWFIERLFYIYFEIWSFITTRVKIYTFSKMSRLHTGIILHHLYYFSIIIHHLYHFSIMYSSSCTGSLGSTKSQIYSV